jgi:ligand-binding SRPBCC domain-containing protein
MTRHKQKAAVQLPREATFKGSVEIISKNEKTQILEVAVNGIKFTLPCFIFPFCIYWNHLHPMYYALYHKDYAEDYMLKPLFGPNVFRDEESKCDLIIYKWNNRYHHQMVGDKEQIEVDDEIKYFEADVGRMMDFLAPQYAVSMFEIIVRYQLTRRGKKMWLHEHISRNAQEPLIGLPSHINRVIMCEVNGTLWRIPIQVLHIK